MAISWPVWEPEHRCMLLDTYHLSPIAGQQSMLKTTFEEVMSKTLLRSTFGKPFFFPVKKKSFFKSVWLNQLIQDSFEKSQTNAGIPHMQHTYNNIKINRDWLMRGKSITVALNKNYSYFLSVAKSHVRAQAQHKTYPWCTMGDQCELLHRKLMNTIMTHYKRERERQSDRWVSVGREKR